jgi:hypothetical protein
MIMRAGSSALAPAASAARTSARAMAVRRIFVDLAVAVAVNSVTRVEDAQQPG